MSPTLTILLTLVSGISWTSAYVDIIRLGFKEETYGMPFFALAFNITWEFIYAFLIYQGFPLQRVVNFVWFLLDLVILYTYFKYGRQEFPKSYERFFVPWSVAALVIAFVTLYFAGTEFPGARGGTYSAFAQNLMMSVLFIAMLVRRDDVLGQSMLIAIFKCLGTLAPTLLIWMATGSKLVLVLGIAIFFYDLLYILMLHRKFTMLGLHPFTRHPR